MNAQEEARKRLTFFYAKDGVPLGEDRMPTEGLTPAVLADAGPPPRSMPSHPVATVSRQVATQVEVIRALALVRIIHRIT